MYSQLEQDKWVNSVLGNKQDGFFIELGASNGVELSNTLFFERFLDWNGICIEPNPKFKDELSKNRKCHICNFCVSSIDDREIDFSVCGYESGAVETAGPFTKSEDVIKVKTKTMESILKMYNAPSVIDYLSLDVEGHEYEILKTFPFDKYIIKCITVEHNEPHTGSEMRYKIRDILVKNGYVFVKGNDDIHNWKHGPIDDFYIHTSVTPASN
jgi:FkbM family methyltransferase